MLASCALAETPGGLSLAGGAYTWRRLIRFYMGLLTSPGTLHNMTGGFTTHKSREVIPVNQKKVKK